MRRIPVKENCISNQGTVQNWLSDRAPRLGAALAYYMALSLAPTVVIVLAVAGWAFGAEAAEGRLVSHIHGLIEPEGAKVIQTMIQEEHRPWRGLAATLLGLITLFFGATAVVGELRDALNTIWRVPDDSTSSTARTIFKLVKERLLSFALVLGAGLFLLASLILNVWVSVAGKYLRSVAAPPEGLFQTADWVVSFIVITALFAFVFKVLPQVPVKWADVAPGAVLTSLLFTAGKFLLGVYLAKAGFADAYGAAARSSSFWFGSTIPRRCCISAGIHPWLHVPLRLNVRSRPASRVIRTSRGSLRWFCHAWTLECFISGKAQKAVWGTTPLKWSSCPR